MKDIVVIGASAGGVIGAREIVHSLPADFRAAVFIVIHTSPTSPGLLAEVIDRAGPLPTAYGRNNEPVRAGRIYVAPPDYHLLLSDTVMRLGHGPKENNFRPAVDPLFRTAAETYGNRVIGIVLSGTLNDGTVGLRAIKRHGGTAIVQNPADAMYSGMPSSAIENVPVDYVVPIAQIPALLSELTDGHPSHTNGTAMRHGKLRKPDVADVGDASLVTHDLPGPPSALVCPECGGALWELSDGKLVQYRCHVGHRFSAESLVETQEATVEKALWTAVRSLEEQAAMQRRMAQRLAGGPLSKMARDYEIRAEESRRQGNVIRQVLLGKQDVAPEAPQKPKRGRPARKRTRPRKTSRSEKP